MLKLRREAQLNEMYAPATVAMLKKALAECGFSSSQYLQRHEDLQVMGLGQADAFAHLLLFGISEKRSAMFGPFPDGIKALAEIPIGDAARRRMLLSNVLSNQINPQDDTAMDRDISAQIEGIRAYSMTPVVIIGDSHSAAYRQATDEPHGQRVPIHISCTGGSARGLGNPASRSQYGTKILNMLRRSTRPLNDMQAPVFLKFGQVDAEFVWHFRRVREGQVKARLEDFEEMAEESCVRYQAFLENVIEVCGGGDVLRICSIFPPVLSDHLWAEGYVNGHIGELEGDRDLAALIAGIRDIDIPDLFMRTRMHAIYNAHLMAMCAGLGLIYADDFSPMISSAGVVRTELVEGHEGRDHHLPHGQISSILGRILDQFTPPAKLGISPF